MAETSDSAGLLPQQTSAVVCSAGGRSRFSDVAEALYAQQEDKEAEEAGAFSDFAYGFVVLNAVPGNDHPRCRRWWVCEHHSGARGGSKGSTQGCRSFGVMRPGDARLLWLILTGASSPSASRKRGEP